MRQDDTVSAAPPGRRASGPQRVASDAGDSAAAAGQVVSMDFSALLREFFSHIDNALLGALLLLAVGVSAFEGLQLVDALWFALGWLVFLPQEWLTHVHILHWRCPLREAVYRHMYRLHYGHHDLPNRHDLMYMPLWLTLPMTLANGLVFFAVLPNAQSARLAFAGALLGYLVFEISHLLCHVPMPVSGIWARVRSRHLAHHFVDEQRCFAVSPPAQWIDRLTGHRAVGEGDALTPARGTSRSALCRTLLPGLDDAWRLRARAHFAHRSSGDVHRSRAWLPPASVLHE